MNSRTVYENGIKALGRTEYKRHIEGEQLSPAGRIKAYCYDCQGGYADGAGDCKTTECPLYLLHPYNPNRLKKEISEKQREQSRKNMARLRSNIPTDARTGGESKS